MAKASKDGVVNGEGRIETARGPRSASIAAAGIKTASNFVNLMESLMDDLISGRISPNVGNAVVRAGANMLKAVELQHRYGSTVKNNARKVLSLTDEAVPA